MNKVGTNFSSNPSAKIEPTYNIKGTSITKNVPFLGEIDGMVKHCQTI